MCPSPIVKAAMLLLVTEFAAAFVGHYLVIGALHAAGAGKHVGDRAGRWIGYLERILIATFAFMGLTSQTVFIFATKAAVISYRIPKSADAKEQKSSAEYMLIGSMASYFVGLLFGLLGHALRTYF